MLLLAIDTSSRDGSIALARCSDDPCQIIEVVLLEGGTFSAQLVPQIAALLSHHGFTKQDIGAFAVVSGPGSFTGLRVGLAAIKALAEVLEKPIATVSLLEAVATTARTPGKVRAALDAGRGEVFVADYNEGQAAGSEILMTREEFFSSSGRTTIVTPESGLAEAARTAGLTVKEVSRPGSDTIAHLGWKKILVGQTVSPDALDANYVRRSDAEIFAKDKS